MSNNYIVCLLLLFFSTSPLLSQDIHFSHLHSSPFALNPALTGIFEGNFRFIANYRNQWKSVTADYRTYMFSADANLIGLGKQSSIGLGAQFYSDVAGDLDYRTSSGNLSLSMIRSFNRDNSHIVAVGGQVGLVGNSFDPNKIVAFEEEPILFDSDHNNIRYTDISAGVLWFNQIQDDQFVYAGASMFHVNRPILSFFDQNDKNQRLYPRFVFHGGGNIDFNQTSSILPNFIYMRQGPYQELTVGSFFKYDFTKKRYPTASFLSGLWIRGLKLEDSYSVDALIAALRFDYKEFIFTFTYDINISSLARASYGRGGPEVSLIYIMGKPNVSGSTHPRVIPFRNKHKIKCPYF